jgi:hypothetical protein
VPRLAIVIPAIGPIDALENSLVSVLEHRPDSCQIVVVLNQPYADPYELAGEVTFVQAPARAGLVDCANLGLAAAQADVVHLLMAGCEVAEGWSDRALARFDDAAVAAVVPLVLGKSGRQELVCRGIDLLPGGVRRLHSGEPPEAGAPHKNVVWGPALFAAFYRAAAVRSVGGLSAAVGDELADADLACSLFRCGYAVAWEPNSQVFASVPLLPACGGRLRRSWHSQRLFGRTLGAFGAARSIVALAAVVWHEFIRALPGPAALGLILARLLASCDVGQYYRHQLRFKGAEAAAQAPPARQWGNRRLDRSHGTTRRAEPVGPTVKTR